MADIIVTVCYIEDDSDEWPRGTLQEVIDWFDAKMGEIPEEFRAVADCEIDRESDYDGCTRASITISYSRPETEDETNARVAKEQRRVQAERDAVRSRELALLRALKAKYEG